MRRKRIAALMAGLDREYQQEFAHGLAAKTKEMGADLLIFACQGFSDSDIVRNDAGENMIFDLPDFSTLDGVVALFATITDPEVTKRIQDHLNACPDLQTISIDRAIPHGITIGFDDSGSMREIMKTLLQRGCRRFAIVTGPTENPVSANRARICREMVRAAGGTVTAEFEGCWTREGGYKAATSMIVNQAIPDAVICCNDDMALGLMDCLEEAGIHVPDNVLVTGFDAKHEAIGRGLTTVHRPVFQAGEMAAQLLIDGLSDPHGEAQPVTLPTEVKYGVTSGDKSATSDVGKEEYFRTVSLERRMMEEAMIHSAAFTSKAAGVENEEEAEAVFADFAKRCGIHEMHIALDPAFLKADWKMLETEGYPEQMQLLASYGSPAQPITTFPTKNLLPDMSADPHSLPKVFLPLYYQNRGFGYAVMDLDFAGSMFLLSVLTLFDCVLMEMAQRFAIRKYADALERLSINDPLTDMFNRRGFDREAAALIDRMTAECKPVVVISGDMDGLKQINDRYGHLCGDEAIRRAGRAFRTLEELGAICSHISGDEFVAIAALKYEGFENALILQISESLDRINRTEPWLCPISMSLGTYTTIPQNGETLSDLMRVADSRMYERKRIRKQKLMVPLT